MTQHILFNPDATILPIPYVPLYLPNETEIARYRLMAENYHRACDHRPFMNHSAIALAVGAKAFNIPIDLLQSQEKKRDLAEARQKLMAFSRIVSIGTPIINPWKGIARAFHRTHATVIHATHKYGEQITAALQGACR